MLPQDCIEYSGDTVQLSFQLWQDKCKNLPWDLTNYKIRFSLVDGTTIIKKATANVSGGSDEQILITNAAQGLFTIYLLKTETATLSPDDYKFYIQVENESGSIKETVLADKMRILKAGIDWENE